jgi:hypothetical protein
MFENRDFVPFGDDQTTRRRELKPWEQQGILEQWIAQIAKGPIATASGGNTVSLGIPQTLFLGHGLGGACWLVPYAPRFLRESLSWWESLFWPNCWPFFLDSIARNPIPLEA